MGMDPDGLPDFNNEHLEAGRQLKTYLRALKAQVDAGEGGEGADDQSAADVPFTPFGDVSSVDVQGAMEEIISRPTIDYIQDTDPTLDDPNTVTAHKVWARLTAPKTYAVRNTANNAWVFFSDVGGFILAPSGDRLVDSSGNPISLTQGVGASRILTNSATLTFNFSTPGEVQPETA